MSSATRNSVEPPSLAIVGGGIAGLTLAIALLTHAPHLPITLYESASAFGEIGAGVAFEPVMVRTMRLIDPRVVAAFEKCSKGNTPPGPRVWMRIRVGDQRKVIGDPDERLILDTVEKKKVRLEEEIFHIPSRGEGPRGGVHRAHLLDELVKLIPEGVAQFRKRLVDITRATDGSGDAVLHFADGSSATHSAVLGCDGIKSRTRAVVLGDDDAKAAVFSGKYAYRGLIPMTQAEKIMNPTMMDSTQMYVGYHGHVLTSPIANGTIINVVAFASRLKWTEKDWVVKPSREELREDFKHWGTTVQSIIESLEKPNVWALFNHPPAPTYYRTEPLICLVGDAAHASTPHQSAGAGMCVEDAYMLSQLLSKCHSKADLEDAFHAYDQVRRPRTQRIVKTSKEAGRLWDFEGENVGDDLVAMQQNAQNRMLWIWDFDIAQDLEKARFVMTSRAKNRNSHESLDGGEVVE